MMDRIRILPLSCLTFGEKILKIVLGILKWGLIIAAVLTIGTVILGLVIGGYLAFGVANAIADGFDDASRAYRPGDCYVWYR